MQTMIRGQLLFRKAQRSPNISQMPRPPRPVAGCTRGMRAACGASCQTLHLQHDGWQVGAIKTTEKEAEIGPDLQAPGKKTQPRFMRARVTHWS